MLCGTRARKHTSTHLERQVPCYGALSWCLAVVPCYGAWSFMAPVHFTLCAGCWVSSAARSCHAVVCHQALARCVRCRLTWYPPLHPHRAASALQPPCAACQVAQVPRYQRRVRVRALVRAVLLRCMRCLLQCSAGRCSDCFCRQRSEGCFAWFNLLL